MRIFPKVFSLIVILAILIPACTPVESRPTSITITDALFVAETESALQTEIAKSTHAFDEELIQELEANPNYLLSYVKSLEEISGPISQALIDFKNDIGKNGKNIVDETNGKFDINQYGILFFKSSDGRQLIFNILSDSGDYLIVNRMDGFAKYAQSNPSATEGKTDEDFVLSTESNKGQIVVLVEIKTYHYTNIVVNVNTMQWEDSGSLFVTDVSDPGLMKSDPVVMEYLAKNCLEGELEYPEDLTGEQIVAFEEAIQKIKVTQPGYEYNGLFTDSRVVRRLNKGVIWGMFVENDTLAIYTPFGVDTYDIETNEELSRLIFRFHVLDLKLSPDGKYIMISSYVKEPSYQRRFSLWEVSSGEKLWEYDDPRKPIAFAFHPDGKTVAFSFRNPDNSGRIHFYEIETGKEFYSKQLNTEIAGLITYTSDGKQLIYIGNEIISFDNLTHKMIAKSSRGRESIHNYGLSPDDSYLFIDSKIYRINEKGAYNFVFTTSGDGPMGFIGDTNQLVVDYAINDAITEKRILDLDNNGLTIGVVEDGCISNETYFSYSNGEIGTACIDQDGDLVVYNKSIGSEKSITKGFIGSPNIKSLSSDESILLTTNNLTDSVFLWDIDSGVFFQQLNPEEDPNSVRYWTSVAISGDNQVVAARLYEKGRTSNKVYYWNVKSGEIIHIKDMLAYEGKTGFGGLAFSKDNNYHLFSLSNSKLVMTNLETDEVQAVYSNYQCELGRLFLSDSGNFAYIIAECNNNHNSLIQVNLDDFSTTEFMVPGKDVKGYKIDSVNNYVKIFYINGDLYDSGIITIDLQTGNEISHIEIAPICYPSEGSISIENNLLALGCAISFPSEIPNNVSFYDLNTGKQLFSFGYDFNIYTLDKPFFIREGKNLLIEATVIDVWDVAKIIEESKAK